MRNCGVSMTCHKFKLEKILLAARMRLVLVKFCSFYIKALSMNRDGILMHWTLVRIWRFTTDIEHFQSLRAVWIFSILFRSFYLESKSSCSQRWTVVSNVACQPKLLIISYVNCFLPLSFKTDKIHGKLAV